MRIGVDVGGTNTDAVLIDGKRVVAWTKQPTTGDISGGVAAAVSAVLNESGISPAAVDRVMIGTTHFTNALVERRHIHRVGIFRLASPSGEALPPLTGWPGDLAESVHGATFLLPGGYEVDGREISAFDEKKVRNAARTCRDQGIDSIAISSTFAPLNATMEECAAAIILDAHPKASVSLSHSIGRLGLIERENGTILNAALAGLARNVVASFTRALTNIGLAAPLYISQNDGTLISAEEAARYPILTIGSGPTNSMRGAAFLTGIDDAVVMDVGGTTCDIGVLANGFPRESSIAVDIGGVRSNFRMPDIFAMGLGGGTRIHLDPSRYASSPADGETIAIGPDSVGYRISSEACLFGGTTLTASDIAVASGKANFGDPRKIPYLSRETLAAIWARIQAILADGVDRMKTASGEAVIIAVGGGHFLIDEQLPGAAKVLRPAHAAVANAVGAAIAQVGAQAEEIVDYDLEPRQQAIDRIRAELTGRIIAAGGSKDRIELVDMDEIFLSYLPGRSAQLRIKLVADLTDVSGAMQATKVSHAH